MDRKLIDQLPFLLTGKRGRVSKEELVAEIYGWGTIQITNALDKVESRYETLSGQKISQFAGLEIFCEMVKLLKDLETTYVIASHEKLLAALQKKVLHYHNSQYNNDGTTDDGKGAKNHDSELPQSNTAHKG